MELYINNNWTERYGNAYIAEAIAWSENGNHATIYAVGDTADEADTKLMGALRELKLVPEASKKGGRVPYRILKSCKNSGGDELATNDKDNPLSPGGQNAPPVK